MEALVSGFEKILWFVYRVFFTLVPPLIFMSISFALLKLNSPQYEDRMFSGFFEITSYKGWLLLVIAFILSIVFEAIAGFTINFREQIKEDLLGRPIYKTLMERINLDLKNSVLQGEKPLIIEDLGFGRVLMIQKFAQISNYFWFFYANYKISSAITVLIHILVLIFLPYTLYIQMGNSQNIGDWAFWLLQSFQLGLSYACIFFINKFVKGKKDPRLKMKVGIIILAGTVFMGFSKSSNLLISIPSVTLAINSFCFVVSFLTALLSYNQNWLVYRVLADILLTLKYGETVFGKDMFPAAEPPKPPIK